MDPKKILFWNVRGLNSKARQDSVRTLLDSEQIDIICLQEIKMQVVDRGIILSIRGGGGGRFGGFWGGAWFWASLIMWCFLL
jgi:hypothetical protein